MLDKESAVSLHDQLTMLIKENLKEGIWKPNQKIPSENEMAAQYGVSRMTVRAVITNMVNEGFLYRVQGKGTFVANTKLNVTTTGFRTFRQQLQEAGYNYRTEVISCSRIDVTSYLANMLGLEPTVKDILFVYRLTYVDEEPVCIHKAFIPMDVDHWVTTENLKNMSLFELLEAAGYKTANINENIKCVHPTESDAKLLNVSTWHPILLVSDVHKTASGKPFILNEYAFRGESVSIDVQFQDKRSFSFVND